MKEKFKIGEYIFVSITMVIISILSFATSYWLGHLETEQDFLAGLIIATSLFLGGASLLCAVLSVVSVFVMIDEKTKHEANI